MSSINRWRVWCVTENAYVEVLLDESVASPTTCPNDPVSHTIDSSQTVIVEAITPQGAQDANGNLITKLTAPHSEDGKPVFVQYPASVDRSPYFTSQGDNTTTGERGGGTRVYVEFFNSTDTPPVTKTADINFIEPVELYDGEIHWSPVSECHSEDNVSLSAILNPSVPTPTPGSGNVNQVPSGLGYNIYVPAPANDGSHTVSLSDFSQPNKAVPVPAESGSGYWLVDKDTGALTPATGQEGPEIPRYHILDTVPLEVFIIKNLGLGNPLGIFELEAQWVQLIHQTWTVRLSATKNTAFTAAEVSVGGWMQLFRKVTT